MAYSIYTWDDGKDSRDLPTSQSSRKIPVVLESSTPDKIPLFWSHRHLMVNIIVNAKCILYMNRIILKNRANVILCKNIIPIIYKLQATHAQ